MITLTEKAIEALKEFASDESNIIVRLKIKPEGCAGFAHDFLFVESIDDMDEVFEFQDNIKLAVDCLSFQYLDGAEVDFQDSTFSRGFTVKNPNVRGSCGCGQSYNF